jgi:hypothetical protein
MIETCYVQLVITTLTIQCIFKLRNCFDQGLFLFLHEREDINAATEDSRTIRGVWYLLLELSLLSQFPKDQDG